MYESTLTKQSDNNTTEPLDTIESITESKTEIKNKTIVLNQPHTNSLKAKNSTIVLDFKTTHKAISSDSFCVEQDSVDEALCYEGLSVDQLAYSTDVEDYKACHPFIYQFMQSRILSGHPSCDYALSLFRRKGFDDDQLQDALYWFVDTFGPRILQWYRDNTPVQVQPLNEDDLKLARMVSKRLLTFKKSETDTDDGLPIFESV